MQFDEAVAAALKAQRAISGMTMKELATAASMSESSIVRYMDGTRQPRMSELQRLAEAMGVRGSHVLEDAERIYARANGLVVRADSAEGAAVIESALGAERARLLDSDQPSRRSRKRHSDG